MAVALAVSLVGPAWMPAQAHAGPPDDDWSLEVTKRDDVLVKQRFSKLKKRPFDQKQWSALKKALGSKGLARMIGRAHRSAPNSVNLGILQAKALWMEGDPAAAAEQLAEVLPRAGKSAEKVFGLRVEALRAAGDDSTAIEALEARAEGASAAKKADYLDEAYAIANRAGRATKALELARALVRATPNDLDAVLRVARAAADAGEDTIADDAYGKATSIAPKRRRSELTAEHASARLDADQPADAATLLWSLVEGNGGRTSDRADWWDLLELAERQAGRGDTFASTMESWLAKRNSKEVAAYRAWARALSATGQDPVPAWRKALEIDPRDESSRAGLIEALEAGGNTEAAVAEYQELGVRSDREVELGLAMANRLITNGEQAKGLAIAAQIQKSAKRNANALLLLVEFYNDVDERDLALEAARALVKQRTRDPDARLVLGEQLWEMQKTDEALEQWNELPRLIRPSHRGYARLAETLQAHVPARKTSYYSPYNSPSSTSRAKLRALAGEALDKALKLSPNNPSYLRLVAITLEDEGKYIESLNAWQDVRKYAEGQHRLLKDEARTRIVELLAGNQRIYDARERQRLRTALVTEAEQALEKPDKKRPERSVEAGRFLAELYTREGNHPDAATVFMTLLERDPDDGDLLMLLASSQRRAGETQAAMETLRKAMEVDENHRQDALAELSELAFESGQQDTAMDAAVEAARNSRDGGRALVRLGELHEREGDLDAARDAYSAAADEDPTDVRSRIRLAELALLQGQSEQAQRIYGELLIAGGPPELMREAGRRALDLAEVAGTTHAMLALALERTKRSPQASEPRSFLLDALDRVGHEGADEWMRDGGQARRDKRVAALRHPLVSVLGRGTAGDRTRAAKHLARLELPDTAVPLARMGLSLTAPREATRAVHDAYTEARVEALRAAAALDDPAALPILADTAKRRISDETPYAALWAVAQSHAPQAAEHLRPYLKTSSAGAARRNVLACVGLARRLDPEHRVSDLAAVSRLAHERAEGTVRDACFFAEASLTSEARAIRLVAHVEGHDPMRAAIAAWRLGQLEKPKPEVLEALWWRYLGPPGLARDAAGAALAELGGATVDRPGTVVPPLSEAGRWGISTDRWLRSVVAPPFEPLTPALIETHADAIDRALTRLRSGTRAERAAAERYDAPASGSPEQPS